LVVTLAVVLVGIGAHWVSEAKRCKAAVAAGKSSSLRWSIM
jgi:hypothetical protein